MSSPAHELPDDPQVLRLALAERDERIAEQQRQNQALQQTVGELQQQIERLTTQVLEARRSRFGQSSERGEYAMADLFDPQEAPAPEDDGADTGSTHAPPTKPSPAPKKGRSRKGRRPLPLHLPRHARRHDYTPEERAELERLHGPLEEFDQEVTETLEYQPGQLYVIRHEVPKYVASDAEGERTVISPTKATSPIPGSQVGASLLAHTLVSKYVDHLPLNRISAQFARDGLHISRQCLCDYSMNAAEVLERIAEEIHKDALDSGVVHGDDTTVAQQEPGKGQTLTARLWTYLGRGRSDGVIPVSYCYTQGRSQDAVLAELAGFEGYLQGDAFIGHLNAEAQEPGLVFVACWAHARRRFEKVARRQKTYGQAHVVMKLIAALYQTEGRLRDQGVTDPEVIRVERQRRAAPILRRLRKRLECMATSLPPKNDLGDATKYALNHWQALCRYIEDGRLEPDNNRAERALRGVCVGRSN
ncbi:MAG: IS66 family transposase, partial [Halorhodospira sp.]